MPRLNVKRSTSARYQSLWAEVRPGVYESGDFRVQLVKGTLQDHPLHQAWGVFVKKKNSWVRYNMANTGEPRRYSCLGTRCGDD